MAGSAKALCDYAELHTLSNFTFLTGASHPEELVRRASELGYQALAITDECSLAGVVRAHTEAVNCDIQLIIGASFALDGRTLVVLAQNRLGYGQLCTLITRARRRAPKGEYQVSRADFEVHLDQCLVLLQPASAACGYDRQQQKDLYIQTLANDMAWLQQHHHGRCALLLERWLDSGDDWRYHWPLAYGQQQGDIPLVCAGGALMHEAGRKPLQDVLTAIRLNKPLTEIGAALCANAERHLRTADQLQQLYPQTLRVQSCVLAARCHFSLDELRYEYPHELVPSGISARDHLRALVSAGEKQRFPDGVPSRVRQMIEHELTVIADLAYEPYFLTINDIVGFARREGILCQGRGSAANSVVCYCLGITEVNPLQVNLLFERFLSRERNEPPDIDVDFEHSRRGEVIQYIYRRYGRERAGIAAAVISYRRRSCVRDIGRALGFDDNYLSWLINQLDPRDRLQSWQEQLSKLGGDSPSRSFRLLLHFIPQLLGFPRHLSQHVGGFIISAGPLSELVPIENAAMADRTLIQWNKDDLEALGLLKIDVLALGILTAMRKALALMSQRDGRIWRLQDIPREDPVVYAMLSQGDSVGVFQVESRAQMNMLPRLRPATYYDLVIQVAIVRPGPIQGDMVHPYLRRRQGLEPVDYPSDEVKSVLESTLGVPIFQEQVIRLAMVAAGFSGGEADQLRRAMAAWRRHGNLAGYQRKLRDGMQAHGYSLEFAERICQQIEGFGEYGFPESHAASFALLVYLCAWLKCHEPAAFCAGLLNSQPMGFYAPAQLIADAQRHGVTVKPVCINASDREATLEEGALRLGLNQIRGLSREAVAGVLQNRPAGGFDSMADFRRRCRLSSRDYQLLAGADALAVLAGNRHQVRWDLLAGNERLELDTEESAVETPSTVALPTPDERESITQDYQLLGLSLRRHPLALLRQSPLLARVSTAVELKAVDSGRLVRVAGVVTHRQRPATRTGITFVTIEDETGAMNLIVKQSTARAQRQALLNSRILRVEGVLEREGEIIHIQAGKLIDLTGEWETLNARSRDFQ